MRLIDKIRVHARYWDCYNDEPEKYDHTNKLVKIADEFAIGFGEWMASGVEFIDDTERGRIYYFKHHIYNTKELLEIYKKEKEL